VTAFEAKPGDPRSLLHNKTPCPACGYQADAAGSPDGKPLKRAPQTGSWSVCFNCTAVNVFEVSPLGVVSLRAATVAELDEFLSHPERRKGLRAVQMVRRNLPPLLDLEP
jgi:hypothetical protein